MANFFGEVYGQVGTVWKKLGMGQKIIIVLVTAALTLGIVGVVYWSSRLEMGTLFGNLSPKSAGAVQAQLDDEGVPYELRDGGTSIAVPKDKVYELRNRIMQQGLIQDGEGLEIFDELQLGMTEFLQNVNLTRAIQGELARTITWMDQVAAAKVLITRPKPTIFTELEKPPTASVTLKLIPGRNLSQREVVGIANIVASAVEGLDASHVTIVDNRGRMLSKTPSEYENDLGSGQFEVKQTYEAALTKKVEGQLDAVVGPNKVRVVVNVELDHQRQTLREEQYSQPDEGKLVMKQRTNTSMSTKTGFMTGGSTGTQAKVTGGPAGPASAPAEPDKDETEDSETEFAVNRRETDTVQMGSTIERLTLAIMIDQTLEDRSSDIEAIVKQAVGYDETRGDSSTTAVIEFNQPDLTGVEEELGSYEQKEFIIEVVKYGIQGLSVAGVLFILFKIMKRSDKKGATRIERRDRAFAPAMADNVPEETRRMRDEVMSAVQSDPVMATDILHEWLKEE